MNILIGVLSNDKISDTMEWVKRDEKFMSMVKEDLENGKTLEWGMFAGGRTQMKMSQ